MVCGNRLPSVLNHTICLKTHLISDPCAGILKVTPNKKCAKDIHACRAYSDSFQIPWFLYRVNYFSQNSNWLVIVFSIPFRRMIIKYFILARSWKLDTTSCSSGLLGWWSWASSSLVSCHSLKCFSTQWCEMRMAGKWASLWGMLLTPLTSLREYHWKWVLQNSRVTLFAGHCSFSFFCSWLMVASW